MGGLNTKNGETVKISVYRIIGVFAKTIIPSPDLITPYPHMKRTREEGHPDDSIRT